jgi:hypothetical protein
MASSLWLYCVAVILGMTYATPERVAKRVAAAELACPERAIDVSCNGAVVFHLALQLRCEARCGEIVATYRCETPLRPFGPIELRYPAVCADRDR